jgi:uncharacterized protein (DUF488 family)
MANAFFTIGHSTRPIPDFVGLLQASNVQVVVDVRTVPRSRTNPQFNRDELALSLAPFGIGYAHMAALGGLRGKQKGSGASPNTFWENDNFRNYADYALTDVFRAGLADLRSLGARETSAIMCAEAVWWRCHRRIIADYLLAAGDSVFHILGGGRVEPARLTEAARPTERGLIYPAGPVGSD